MGLVPLGMGVTAVQTVLGALALGRGGRAALCSRLRAFASRSRDAREGAEAGLDEFDGALQVGPVPLPDALQASTERSLKGKRAPVKT